MMAVNDAKRHFPSIIRLQQHMKGDHAAPALPHLNNGFPCDDLSQPQQVLVPVGYYLSPEQAYDSRSGQERPERDLVFASAYLE